MPGVLGFFFVLGKYLAATNMWNELEKTVESASGHVDFYNILNWEVDNTKFHQKDSQSLVFHPEGDSAMGEH